MRAALGGGRTALDSPAADRNRPARGGRRRGGVDDWAVGAAGVTGAGPVAGAYVWRRRHRLARAVGHGVDRGHGRRCCRVSRRCFGSFAATWLAAIADGSRRTVGSRRDHGSRALLVATECALAVVLLACSALLLSAFDRSSRIDPGFDPTLCSPRNCVCRRRRIPPKRRGRTVITGCWSAFAAVPGVTVGSGHAQPLRPGLLLRHGCAHRGQADARWPGAYGAVPAGKPRLLRHDAHSGAERARLRRRRRHDQPWVAVVSRRFADQHWPGEDPIGRRIRRGTNPRSLTVVGVVGDVSDVGFSQPPAPTVYISFDQNNVAITPVSLVVRTSRRSAGVDQGGAGGGIRGRSCAADRLGDHARTVPRRLARAAALPRHAAAGAGRHRPGAGRAWRLRRDLAVGRRANGELGVRQALGASPAAVATMVVWQMMRVVFAGLGVGAVLTASRPASCSKRCRISKGRKAGARAWWRWWLSPSPAAATVHPATPHISLTPTTIAVAN